MYEHIQYKIEGNIIDIFGTNEGKDIKVSLKCWPKKGWHAGAYEEAKRIYSKNIDYFSGYRYIIIKGYSMGGAIAQILAFMLQRAGIKVECFVKGSYPVTTHNIAIHGECRIYGNDPVPALFPWFKHCVKREFEGPKRWFPFVFKDHLGYNK